MTQCCANLHGDEAAAWSTSERAARRPPAVALAISCKKDWGLRQLSTHEPPHVGAHPSSKKWKGRFSMSDKPSLALTFFERIMGAANPIAELRSLYISIDRQSETDYLEFKTFDAKSFKDQFRKALCGFSNNQGGVLIWGIDARPAGTPPVDAACGEILVPDPLAMKSRLLELQHGAIDPPVANVRVEAIETAPGSK